MKIRVREGADNKRSIFCLVRKKWILYSNEEVVRQWFIILLIERYKIPVGLIAVEKGFILDGGKPLRVDIVVYDTKGMPFILVECKAKDVKIDEEVFRQASKYNAHFRAPYIILTNSADNLIFKTEDFVSYSQISEFPTIV